MATAGALHGGPLTRCDTWKAILVLGSFSTLRAQRTIRRKLSLLSSLTRSLAYAAL